MVSRAKFSVAARLAAADGPRFALSEAGAVAVVVVVNG